MRLAWLALAVVLVAPAASAQGTAPWPDGAFNPYGHTPIRVYLDVSNLTNDTWPYADSVRAAWAWWETGGNGALAWQPRFNETTTRSEADIVVWFVVAELVSCGATGTGQGCGAFGGPAYAERQGRIDVATLVPSAQPDLGPQPIPYAEMRRVAEHELGHALGLPHSAKPGDIMYPGGEVVTDVAPPRGPFTQNQLLLVVGAVLGGIVVIVGAQRAYHAVLDGRDRRRGERTDAQATPPLAKGEVDAAPRGSYAPQGRCPGAPDGEHRFEARSVVEDGATTTWLVCRLCRYPKKL